MVQDVVVPWSVKNAPARDQKQNHTKQAKKVKPILPGTIGLMEDA